MPLDPVVANLLVQMEGRPPLSSVPPEQARANPTMMSTAYPKGPELAEVLNLRVKRAGVDVPVRVYRPSHQPVAHIAFFHGGGWVIGSTDGYDNFLRALAQESNCEITSADYRLAPEHRFPAAVDDSMAVAEWVRERAEAASKPFMLMGDSAGANLAAAVAQLQSANGTQGAALQLLVYPVTDANLDTPSYLENAQGYMLTRDSMAWFWDLYVPDVSQRSDPRASPLRAASLAGLPPALVMTAEFDPLRDEGEAYAQALASAGTPAVSYRYPGMIHGFIALRSLCEQGARAHRHMLAAIGAAARGEDVAAALGAQQEVV